MSEALQCYRCGASLAALSLPLSRLDLCPHCSVELHVCRMCAYYDPAVAEQCREDDAEEVRDKTRANFCDYFKPRAGAHDPALSGADERAREQLDSLFGGGTQGDDGNAGGDDAAGAAEDLFR